jgi:hypothetical protein
MSEELLLKIIATVATLPVSWLVSSKIVDAVWALLEGRRKQVLGWWSCGCGAWGQGLSAPLEHYDEHCCRFPIRFNAKSSGPSLWWRFRRELRMLVQRWRMRGAWPQRIR